MYMLFSIVLVMIAVACSKDKDNKNEINANEANDKESIYEKVNVPDKVTIDFQLDEVDTVQRAKSYKVNHIAFDKQKLIDTFIENEIVEEIIWGEGPQVRAKGSNIEEYLNLYDGGSAYFDDKEIAPMDFAYGRHVAGKQLDYRGKVARTGFGYRAHEFEFERNSDYESYTDLDFLPYEEAFANVEEAFEKVDMPQLILDETYSVDLETMQAHYDIYWEDYRSKDEEKINWTKEDEFYLFSMQQLVDDIPIVNTEWHTPGVSDSPLGSMMPFTGVSVLYDKDGISELSTTNMIEIDEEIGENDLLSIYDALEKLMKAYAAVVLEEEVNITSAQLLYLIFPTDDGYELIPGWIFTSETTRAISDEKEVVRKYDVVHAVTGELYEDR